MADEYPIFRFNAEREAIVEETVRRVIASTRDTLFALNDAAYHEARRLDGSRKPKDQAELEEWRRLARRLGRMSELERRDKLREIVEGYGWDVAGNFDPRVYRFSTSLVPSLVTGLLAPRKLATLVRDPRKLFGFDALAEKFLIDGEVDLARKLAARGTVVFVPTHSSNMDSIVFGHALDRADLPPATYGAGKNLFTNPVLAFFMRNLGAYRVDRRLRHKLYKDVLKAYSCVLIERGYHSLFFPGGTRSRSGGIERHLKLGLAGTGIEAYARTLLSGHERRVYFVPATINYLITLEAETLIRDYLSEAGKARYIIEDDESSRPGRMARFVSKLLGHSGAVHIRFGAALDPYGNGVDEHGVSHDHRGRPVDPASYLRDLDGSISLNPSREMQYTRQLGEELAVAYRRNAVAMATHIVAAAAFGALRRAAGTDDLFAVLRMRDQITLSRDELAREVLGVKDRLLELEKHGEAAVSSEARRMSGGDLVEQAIQAFRGYHTSPVIQPREDGLALSDTNLLFYYQNRLAVHGVGWDPTAHGEPRPRPAAA
ncbi:MAG: 1-acyl-sn-glycerol-3-phosphate acyltransferase [Polyangiaceae bacterium]|nr:1-acyl-sn-glycerol-3-phosphate acyltransferase [Polyangiaceae bacterium]